MTETPSMHAMLWQAVCLIWQECSVQKVIDVLCDKGGTDALTVELQNRLVSAMQETERLVRSKISSTYKFKLLSRLTKVIEKAGNLVDDLLADSLADALQHQAAEKQEYNNLCFFCGTNSYPSIGNTDPEHTDAIHEALGMKGRPEFTCSSAEVHVNARLLDWVVIKASSDMLAGDTGCHVWQAGLYLSQWILNNGDWILEKRCLELGSGTGLVGVALVRSGASEVLLTDGNEEAVTNCRQNIDFNEERGGEKRTVPGLQRKCDVSVEALQWGSRRIGADIIVASDVVYNETVLSSLVKQLQMELRNRECCPCDGEVELRSRDSPYDKKGSPIGLFASTVRNPATLEKFVQLCQAGGLVVQELERVQLGQGARSASSNIQAQWQHCQALQEEQEIVLHHIS